MVTRFRPSVGGCGWGVGVDPPFPLWVWLGVALPLCGLGLGVKRHDLRSSPLSVGVGGWGSHKLRNYVGDV